MVDLPSYTPKGITAEAPTPGITPGAIESAGNFQAQNFDKMAKGLEDVSVPLAEEAGRQAVQKAVTRNPDGSINVDTPATSFILGRAGEAYANIVEAGALANLQTKVQQDLANIHQQFAGDPDGFRQNAGDYVESIAGKYDGKIGYAVKNLAENYATQHYDTLVNNKASLDLQRVVSAIDTGILSAKSDLSVLVRGGVSSGPQWEALNNQVLSLTAAKTADPRLAYPKETADFDLQTFHNELAGQGVLYKADQIYHDKGVNPDGTPSGGAGPAIKFAQSILTDQSISLPMAERQKFVGQAVTLIHENETIRRQAIYDARGDLSDMQLDAAAGLPIADRVDAVAQKFRDAGYPQGVARTYALGIRTPQVDNFGNQPIPAMRDQLDYEQGMSRQKGAYQFFLDKGWTPAQAAGIVGGLRGETASLNTTQVHDGGMGIGISGWNGQRRAALSTYAAANKMDPSSLTTQLSFVDYELRNNEKTAGDTLSAATTPEAAGDATLSYFRPAGWDQPGAHPERAQYARQAFNAFNGVGPSEGATPAWLQINHARVLSGAVADEWKTVMKDWSERQFVPSDQRLNDFITAARATHDDFQLEKMGHDIALMKGTQDSGTNPLDAQHANISEGERLGASGLLEPGEAALLKAKQQRYDQITKGLNENPMATAVANFRDLPTPPPLDLKNPQNLAAGLQQRAYIAHVAARKWQSGPLSTLDAPDLHQVQAALDTPDPAVKAQIFQAIATLPEDVRNATLAHIGKDRPDLMVAVAAGSLMRQAPEIAQSILRGQEAVKADKGYLPTAAGKVTEDFSQELDKRLPAAAFSLEGRTTDNGAYEVARGMIKARYADLSAQVGDTTGKVNNERLQQATDDVTGGILSHNGGSLIAPQRGIPQRQFDQMLWGVTDNDLSGVTTLNGQPVTADYLRGSAQLESFGDGRYLVRLGKNPMRPIYAFQNANTEAPRAFVLDLRNRPSTPNAPLTGYEAANASNMAHY